MCDAVKSVRRYNGRQLHWGRLAIRLIPVAALVALTVSSGTTGLEWLAGVGVAILAALIAFSLKTWRSGPGWWRPKPGSG